MTSKNRVKIISITFPPTLLREMGEWAEIAGVSRSEFLRHAVHYYIAEFLKKRRYKSDK
jgi:metal-responsive CopG/Arc/MetJ family transcriptional regulator